MMQLKEVIVRKRPRPAPEQADAAGDDGTVADFRSIVAERDEAPQADAATAEGPAPETAPRRPQIWDIEAEDTAGGTADEEAAPSEALPKRARPRPQPEAAPAKFSGGRVKTRILGFHSGDLDGDVFGQESATPATAAMFPAGWIVVVDGPGRGASFAVAAGVSTIGRGEDQTIRLDFGDASVSRQNHASVAYDDEQNKFFVGHGGKSNIVRRNGNPVLSTEDLEHGDLIRIGKTTLRFVALCGADFTWDDNQTGKDSDAADA